LICGRFRHHPARRINCCRLTGRTCPPFFKGIFDNIVVLYLLHKLASGPHPAVANTGITEVTSKDHHRGSPGRPPDYFHWRKRVALMLKFSKDSRTDDGPRSAPDPDDGVFLQGRRSARSNTGSPSSPPDRTVFSHIHVLAPIASFYYACSLAGVSTIQKSDSLGNLRALPTMRFDSSLAMSR